MFCPLPMIHLSLPAFALSTMVGKKNRSPGPKMPLGLRAHVANVPFDPFAFKTSFSPLICNIQPKQYRTGKSVQTKQDTQCIGKHTLNLQVCLLIAKIACPSSKSFDACPGLQPSADCSNCTLCPGCWQSRMHLDMQQQCRPAKLRLHCAVMHSIGNIGIDSVTTAQ